MTVVDEQQASQRPAVSVRTVSVRAGRELLRGRPGSGQLYWSDEDNAALFVDGRAVAVGPRRAVWLPPGGTAQAAVDAELSRVMIDLPAGGRVDETLDGVGLLDLDDVVVVALRALRTNDGENSEAMVALLLDRLGTALDTDLDAPIRPIDELARQVADALISDPADRRGLDWWAAELAVSERTIRRRFVEETGVTYSEWCTGVRMHHARALIDDGVPMSSVARRVGYRTLKAFRAALRHPSRRSEQLRHPIGPGGEPESTGAVDPSAKVEPVGATIPTVRSLRHTHVITDSVGREVSVPSRPARIAALHQFTLGEPLLALDAPLVAVSRDSNVTPWSRGLVRHHDVAGIEQVGTVSQPDLVALRNVEPDVILAYSFAGWTFDGCDLDRLQQIAPTVAVDEDLPESDHLHLVATIAGRVDELARQRAQYDEAIEALAASLPDEFRRLTFASAAFDDGALHLHTQINPNPLAAAVRALGVSVTSLADEDSLYVELRSASSDAAGHDIDVLLVETRSGPLGMSEQCDLRSTARCRHLFCVDPPAGISYDSGRRILATLASGLHELESPRLAT